MDKVIDFRAKLMQSKIQEEMSGILTGDSSDNSIDSYSTKLRQDLVIKLHDSRKEQYKILQEEVKNPETFALLEKELLETISEQSNYLLYSKHSNYQILNNFAKFHKWLSDWAVRHIELLDS